jgi:hypothetical protein
MSAALHDSVEDCDACPAGTYLEGTYLEGDAMNANAALHDSVEDCGACPAGTYLEDDASSAALHDSVEDCDACPAGTYLEDDASSAALHDSVEDCNVCPAGTYLEDDASSAALHDSVEDCTGFCPAGRYLEDEATSPSLHDSLGDCTYCSAGSYSSSLGRTSECTSCPDGTVSPPAHDLSFHHLPHLPCSLAAFRHSASGHHLGGSGLHRVLLRRRQALRHRVRHLVRHVPWWEVHVDHGDGGVRALSARHVQRGRQYFVHAVCCG